jgi:hypothetical protein
MSAEQYKWTLADLRKSCPLLDKIEVIGHSSSVAGCQYVKSTEELVGRNHLGEIVVRVKGTKTPSQQLFRDRYQVQVAAGMLKKHEPTKVDGPDDPPGYGDR